MDLLKTSKGRFVALFGLMIVLIVGIFLAVSLTGGVAGLSGSKSTDNDLVTLLDDGAIKGIEDNAVANDTSTTESSEATVQEPTSEERITNDDGFTTFFDSNDNPSDSDDITLPSDEFINDPDSPYYNWKRYINPIYGYRLNYPSQWILKEAEPNNCDLYSESCKKVTKKGDLVQIFDESYSVIIPVMEIYIGALPYDDLCQRECYLDSKIEEILIDGQTYYLINGLRLVARYEPDNSNTSDKNSYCACPLIKDNLLYSINIGVDTDPSEVDKEIYRQILESFIF